MWARRLYGFFGHWPTFSEAKRKLVIYSYWLQFWQERNFRENPERDESWYTAAFDGLIILLLSKGDFSLKFLINFDLDMDVVSCTTIC